MRKTITKGNKVVQWQSCYCVEIGFIRAGEILWEPYRSFKNPDNELSRKAALKIVAELKEQDRIARAMKQCALVGRRPMMESLPHCPYCNSTGTIKRKKGRQ